MKMFKRFIIMLFIFSLAICNFTAVNAEEKIKVMVNGKQLSFDVDPVLIKNKTMVPMRAIFETLDANISWNDAEQIVTGIKGSKKIILQENNRSKYPTIDDFMPELIEALYR